jgi:arylsulfatase A-like enzyme
VLGRLGGVPPVASQPPRTARPLQIQQLTRNALPAVAEGIEAGVPEGATTLLFSTAIAAADAAVGPARFVAEVRHGEGGDWEVVFDGPRTPREPGWRDLEIRLSPGASHLRLTVQAKAGHGARWGSVAFLGPDPGSARRPNVVIVVLDTLGASYLSAFAGPPGTSPNIDAFFERAFSFRRAFSQHSTTLVSHMSLFSADYPIRHGPRPATQTVLRRSLVGRFAEAGYRTAAFTDGGFVSSGFGFSHGFDRYHDGVAELTDQLTGSAAEIFARGKGWLASARGPVLLFLHTYAVHSPYIPRSEAGLAFANDLTPGDPRVWSEPWQGLRIVSNNGGGEPFDAAELRRLRALHLGEVHEIDALVGDLLDYLDESGLADETILVFTSDHGEEFGGRGIVGHAGSLRNRVLHVPLALAGPGIPVGSTDVPVELADLMPTLLELVDLPVPEHRDGQSRAGLLRGGRAGSGVAFSETRWVPSECARAGVAEDCAIERFAVQTGRFKLERSAVPPYARLFDLSLDPQETRDVAAEHPAELAHHAALLDGYLAMQGAEAPALEALRPSAETLERLRQLGYVDEVEALERAAAESQAPPVGRSAP